MVMLAEPESVMTGGVVSVMCTVRVCCTAALPELSDTSYCLV